MVMPRLSVSLDAEQDEWVLNKKQELGISKGKVIRECIKEVQTGESLLSTPVQSGESTDGDRYHELEARLESLEKTINNTVIKPGHSADSEPTPAGIDREPPTHQTASPDRTDQDISPPEHSDDIEADSKDRSPPEDDSPELPGSLLGGDHPAEDDIAHSQPGSSTTESEERRDQLGPAADAADTSSDDTLTRGPATPDDPAPDHGPSQTRENDATDSEGGGSNSSAGSTSSSDLEDRIVRDQQAADDTEEEEEIEKYDVDKSDANAVQSHLDSVLEQPDHATAVFACWTRLRDRGTLHTRSMQSFHEDYPLGYDDPRKWWTDAIEPALVKIPGVQPPEGGGKLYRFSY